jgi:general secretion pathway protein G
MPWAVRNLRGVLFFIVAIGLLGIVLPALFSLDMPRKRDMRVTNAIAQGINLRLAINKFKSDYGRYPTSAEGFDALLVQPHGNLKWHGPYIPKGLDVDPWGHRFVYETFKRAGHDQYLVTSYGASGTPNGHTRILSPSE